MSTFEEMTTEELTLLCTQEYAEISLREKKLDLAKKELFKRMEQNDVAEVKSPFGRFYKKVVTAWTMPDDVVALKATLAEAEERAKAEGRATKTEKTTYSYGALKKEDAI